MLALSSQEAVLASIAQAREVSCSAFILRPGRLLNALESAAAGGAEVRVRLDGFTFGDERGRLAANQAAVDELRTYGADAALGDPAGPPLHLKSVVADGKLFLDDRNWPGGGRDTILALDGRDEIEAVGSTLAGVPAQTADLATVKGSALALEASTIAAGAGDAVECESESFGSGSVCAALRLRAEGGAHVRLLVDRKVNGAERRALRTLAGAGVEVRVGGSAEKIALAGDRAWIGSANATSAAPGTLDWGLRTADGAIVGALRGRFEEEWAAGRPFALGSDNAAAVPSR